jgi:hypothetical protein
MNLQPITSAYKTAAPYAIPVLIILFLFSLKTCTKYSGQLDQYSAKLDSFASLAQHYENALGQQIAENKQIKIQSADDLKKMTDTIFKLKKSDARKTAQVTEYARINQALRLQIALAPWDTGHQVTVTPGTITDDSGTISVPRRFHYEDSTVRLNGSVLIAGVRIDSLVVPNTVNFRVLSKKTGFLGLGRTSEVQVLNSNPAVRTTGVLSIAVPPTLNWWQRIGKPVTFAILAAAITSQVVK